MTRSNYPKSSSGELWDKKVTLQLLIPIVGLILHTYTDCQQHNLFLRVHQVVTLQKFY